MGLGRAICPTTVEFHGGSIRVAPNGPRGAVLQFALPASGRRASLNQPRLHGSAERVEGAEGIRQSVGCLTAREVRLVQKLVDVG